MALRTVTNFQGLATDPSPHLAGENALVEAQNVVINRYGIIEPRPSFLTHRTLNNNSLVGGSYIARKLMAYDGEIFAFCENGSAERLIGESDDTQVTYGGAALNMSMHEVHGQEMRQNFYVTTDDGVLRLTSGSDRTADLTGIPIGLQGFATSSAGTGHPTGNAWAYRVAYARTVNGAKIIGAPSGRFTASYGGAGSAAMTLTLPLNSTLVATDVIQIYRSRASGGASTEANDELFLCVEYEISSADVTAGVATVIEEVADANLGAALYTNAGQSGILQAHYRPPRARIIRSFGGMMFYGNTTQWQRKTITLANVVDECTTGQGLVNHVVTFTCASGSTTITIVTGGPPDANWVGLAFTDANATPGVGGTPGAETAAIQKDSRIVSFSGATITLDKPTLSAVAVADDGSCHAWIYTGRYYYFGNSTTWSAALRTCQVTTTSAVETARSMAHVVNSDTNVSAYGYAVATGTLGTAATLSLEKRTLGGSASGIRGSNLVTPDGMYPVMATDSDYLTMDDDARVNRLMWSRLLHPEFVPIVNYIDIGGEDERIQNMAATRDSLFVFKRDGVWRVTGTSPENLRVDVFDQNLKLVNDSMVVEHKNKVYAWTNRGLVAISEFAIEAIQRPFFGKDLETIELGLVPLANERGPFAASNELKEYVLFGIPDTISDTNCWELWYYNTRTLQWTLWSWADQTSLRTWGCGLVDPDNGRMLLGGRDGDNSRAMIYEEIVSGNTQFSNQLDFSGTVANVANGGDTLEFTGSGYSAAVGDSIIRGAAVGVITAINGSVYTMARSGTFTNGAGTAYKPYTARVKFMPMMDVTPGIAKQYQRISLHFEELLRVERFDVVYETPLVPNSSETPVSHTGQTYVGTSATPLPKTIEVGIARDQSKTDRLSALFILKQGNAKWGLSAYTMEYRPVSTRIAREV